MVETMTDEEAMLSLRTAMCSPNCPGYESLGPDGYREDEDPICPECYKGKAMDYIRTRLAQKPKVTQEQYQKILGYVDGYMAFADCILDTLGLEAEED